MERNPTAYEWAQIMDMLHLPNLGKIHAIKLHRNLTNSPLKVAKDEVEAMQAYLERVPKPQVSASQSMRDYFAAKAMQGMVTGLWSCDAGLADAALAKSAYAVADAMLAQRAALEAALGGK